MTRGKRRSNDVVDAAVSRAMRWEAIDYAPRFEPRIELQLANLVVNSMFPGGVCNAVVLVVHIAPDPNHPKLNEFLAECAG
jgi:hypothetical protein